LEGLGVDVSSPLWGSDLLLTDPTPIINVHQSYVDAGADLVESSTYVYLLSRRRTLNLTLRYPLSVESILREYPTKSTAEAEAILHTGLSILPSSSRSILALGPYGATTKPGAEYSGLYPPPYGSGTVLDPSPSNYLSQADDNAAEQALYEFHLSRLQAYSRSNAWDAVEWIGFETIPLLREVKAIRRAMGALGGDKKFWIACTFPDGQCSQRTEDGGRVPVEQVIRTLLEEGTGRPDGIGINCTNPAYISSLVETFTNTLRSLPNTTDAERPSFVLYPDGGQVYDPISRTWSKEKLTPKEWTARIMEIVQKVNESGLWSSIVVGGCCKTSPEEIAELRKKVDQYLGGQS
jgi:homocysteine S-methyltransferase